jgi:hypothetical protein
LTGWLRRCSASQRTFLDLLSLLPIDANANAKLLCKFCSMQACMACYCCCTLHTHTHTRTHTHTHAHTHTHTRLAYAMSDERDELIIYIYKDFSINWSFFVVALNFVLLTLSSFVVSVYNKTPPQRRSHSRVFTPPSPARGGGGAQFCYPSGVGPDLAEGRGVVPRCSVPILGLPSGVARGPAGPTDRGWGPLSRADRATDPGLGCKCIMAAPH